MADDELRRLRQVLEGSREAYLCTTEAGVVVDCNRAFERLSGWSRDELIGTVAAERLIREERRELHAGLWARAAAGRAYEAGEPFEVILQRRDGARVVLEVTGCRTTEGDRVLLNWLCRDVTERVAMMDELAERAQRLDEAQRIAQLGSWHWETRSGAVRWSNQLQRILGVDDEFVPSVPAFLERLHPEDRAWVEGLIAASLESGDPLGYEARVIRPDGSVRWIVARGEAERSADGAVRAMTGTVQDITERREERARLAAAEEHVRAAFEHSPLGILLWRADAGVFQANAAAGRIYGREASELIGAQPQDVIHPDDVPVLGELIGELLEGRRETLESEHRVIRPSGTIGWVHSTSVVVSGTGDEPYLLVQLQDITARKNAEAELVVRANVDALTGLESRDRFHERVAAELARQAPDGVFAALLLLDLDGFKDVNDGLGHHAGDLVLQEVGRRLRAAVRGGDAVARLGGDEFALLVTGLRAVEDAIAVAANVSAELEAPFDVEGMKLHVGGSIGISVASEEGRDAGTLLQKADIAMYRAKTLRSGWAVYESDQDDVALSRLALVSELRGAIERGELDVAYQPVVETSSGRPVTVEALARWTPPSGGPVPPDRFIPLAEQADLIVPLTRLIVRRAAAACAAWSRAGHRLNVAVNLSLQVLETCDILALVDEELAEAGLPLDRLTLEITESALAADAERVSETLAALRAKGVCLAIDDFGTGYSAMSHLKHLPVQELKIDRSFVREVTSDVRDLSIVRSLVRLAHSLELRVVAEGVESRAAMEALDGIGCDLVQGYGIARPMPEADVAAWLERAAPTPQATTAPTGSRRAKPRDLLVVDDSPAVRALLAHRAGDAGWRVREAASVEEALADVGRSVPDVVVLDHQLPGISGVEALPQLRALGFDGPILLFTRFLTEAMPAIRLPLEVWPVPKANPDAVLELLDAYRATVVEHAQP